MVGKDPPEEIIQLYTYLLFEDMMFVGFKFYLPLKTGIMVIKDHMIIVRFVKLVASPERPPQRQGREYLCRLPTKLTSWGESS